MLNIERVTSQKGGTIRRILGIGLAGFFFGMGDGIITAILPIFIAQIGSGAAVLGLIEGCADAALHLVRKRGPAVRTGGWRPGGLLGPLLASAQGFLAFTLSPLIVFLVRSVSAAGRGLRGSIPEADLHSPTRASRTSRFYRTMEQSGTFLGPTLVLASIGLFPLRDVFLLSFPLSFLAIASLGLLVREAPKPADGAARVQFTPLPLPRSFYPFFAGAGFFRLGNFTVTLLLLRAYELLTRDHGAARAAHLVVLLYIFHHLLYSVTAAVVAKLSFRIGKGRRLIFGYFLVGSTYLGFVFIPPVKSYIGLLPALMFFFFLFALGGIGQSLVDATERTLMTELFPEPSREKGDRALTQVQAIGALVSSAAVGVFWFVFSPTVGFLYAALMSLLGGVLLLRVSGRPALEPSRSL